MRSITSKDRQNIRRNNWKRKRACVRKIGDYKLIDADFQLLLRINVGLRNNEKIEKDDRTSKFNYRSRQGYSIEIITS